MCTPTAPNLPRIARGLRPIHARPLSDPAGIDARVRRAPVDPLLHAPHMPADVASGPGRGRGWGIRRSVSRSMAKSPRPRDPSRARPAPRASSSLGARRRSFGAGGPPSPSVPAGWCCHTRGSVPSLSPPFAPRANRCLELPAILVLHPAGRWSGERSPGSSGEPPPAGRSACSACAAHAERTARRGPPRGRRGLCGEPSPGRASARPAAGAPALARRPEALERRGRRAPVPGARSPRATPPAQAHAPGVHRPRAPARASVASRASTTGGIGSIARQVPARRVSRAGATSSTSSVPCSGLARCRPMPSRGPCGPGVRAGGLSASGCTHQKEPGRDLRPAPPQMRATASAWVGSSGGGSLGADVLRAAPGACHGDASAAPVSSPRKTTLNPARIIAHLRAESEARRRGRRPGGQSGGRANRGGLGGLGRGGAFGPFRSLRGRQASCGRGRRRAVRRNLHAAPAHVGVRGPGDERPHLA